MRDPASAFGPLDHATAPAPLALTASQMDRVTAGAALLLPAAQTARFVGLLPGLSAGGLVVLPPVAPGYGSRVAAGSGRPAPLLDPPPRRAAHGRLDLVRK